tara:strand:- start:85398 stop:85688 length:291 start_codon:yes stop_codon:yes gene_type:complete
MSDGNQYYIARGIDDPIPIFFFDPVDFVMIVTFFGLGIIMKQLLVGIVLSYSVFKLSKIMRKGAKRGVMPHSLWKLGLLQDKGMKRFNSLKTDYIN